MPAEVESMFYAGETPWHKLGTKLDNPATSEEAIAAAGLDWTVGLVPVTVLGTVLTNYHAIVRETDRKVYSIVKSRYTPVQNRQAFGFFDTVVGSKLAIYHTAGSLREGARIWILAQLSGEVVVKGDQVDKFICLTSSHDGTMAVKMFWTPIRVVCMNTLSMAEGSASHAETFYSRHTPKFETRVEDAQKLLGLANQFYAKFQEQASYLASHQLPTSELPKLLAAVFTPEIKLLTSGLDRVEALGNLTVLAPQTKKAMETVGELFVTGRGNNRPEIAGTKWAAFNAVAEFVDYYRKPRLGKDDNRLNSAWFGGGAEMKQRAFEYLLKK